MEDKVRQRILDFFGKNKDGFVSGEDISNMLGVTRACTWKYMEKLREDGYIIEAVPHRGYRLRSSPDKLYAHAITGALRTKTIGKRSVHHFESLASTNDRAYELAENGEPEGALVIAEGQTRGKGRLGRKWESPKTGGLYMSIVLRPDADMDEIPAITVIAGISITDAVEKTCGVHAELKWPNDVLSKGKKLGGILTEIKAQPDMVDFLILGIGVNVNTAAGKLPAEATSLSMECGHSVGRLELLRYVLEEFEKNYLVFRVKGFAPFREKYKKISMMLGRRLKVSEHHRMVEGTAVDIDEKGALIIRADNGTLQRIFSGDVLLCREK